MENGHEQEMQDSRALREKALDTIAKCLTLAADPGATDGERDNAARMAERIMAKWQIGSLEARLKAEARNGQKPRTTANVKDSSESLFDPQADWEIWLAMGIASTFNSRMLVSHDHSSLQFFGSADDLESIDYFFNKLRIEIDSWAEDAYPKGVRDRRAYAAGMVARVRLRMDELYKFVREAMSNECRDLILVDKALVDQRINELYPKLGKMKARTISNHGAYARGYQDGNNLNLSSGKQQVR